VKCDRVGSNACEGHLRSIWDFNTENADELGNGFPKGMPCSPEEPFVTASVSAPSHTTQEHTHQPREQQVATDCIKNIFSSVTLLNNQSISSL
jgi:hypothetical protein